jgi:glycosyltransferase involved in cell wall biosynthesis
MRIAYAMINCNRRDGSARAVNEVAERMAKRGHEVHLYARKAEDLDLDLIKWHRVPGPGWPEIADFYSYYLATNRLLAKERYDIVHSIGVNTARANVYTIQNIQPAKVAILKQLGSEEKVSLPRRLTRWLYLTVTSAIEKKLYTARPGKALPTFLPVSRGVEAELRRHYAIGDAPVRIIPNAADVEKFRPLGSARETAGGWRSEARGQREAWRREQGIPEDVPLAVFAGGEWARKGLQLAIQGLGKMQNKTLWLFVAGDDADGERFKTMAKDAGVADRVVFGGFRNDVEKAMGAADSFLFPSYYEAFSLATIEAAACGLPVVASKISGTEDFIVPGETGEFVKHDAADVAVVLDHILSDREKLTRMGIAARCRVEAEYTWDRVADMTEGVYRDILAKRDLN